MEIKIVYLCDETLQVCPATFEEDGYIKYVCSDCGHLTIPTITIRHSKIIIIPRLTRAINEEAFSNVAAEQVYIPETVERIDSRAFSSCPNLLIVVFNGMTTYIDDAAFDLSSGVVFYCLAGSYAEEYAIAHGFPYISH